MTETPTRGAFLRDVLAGLSVPEGEQKTLPCRWLYDEQGSALFEAITQLPEYYLTRTETQILTDIASTLAKHMGEGVVLIEYGAGASVKTRLLLDAAHTLRAYVPIDVSEAFLLQTAERLRSDYPDLSGRGGFSIGHLASRRRRRCAALRVLSRLHHRQFVR